MFKDERRYSKACVSCALAQVHAVLNNNANAAFQAAFMTIWFNYGLFQKLNDGKPTRNEGLRQLNPLGMSEFVENNLVFVHNRFLWVLASDLRGVPPATNRLLTQKAQ